MLRSTNQASNAPRIGPASRRSCSTAAIGRRDCRRRSPRADRGDPTVSWWRWPPRGRRRATAVAAQAVSRWCCRRRASRRGRGTSSPGREDRRRRARGWTVSRRAPRRRPTAASMMSAHFASIDGDALRRKVFHRITSHLVIAVGRHDQGSARSGEHPQRRRDRRHARAEVNAAAAPSSSARADSSCRQVGIRRCGRSCRVNRPRSAGCGTPQREPAAVPPAAPGIASDPTALTLRVESPYRPAMSTTPAWCCGRAAARPPRARTIPCGTPGAPHRSTASRRRSWPRAPAPTRTM